jgi:hypothetical protein
MKEAEDVSNVSRNGVLVQIAYMGDLNASFSKPGEYGEEQGQGVQRYHHGRHVDIYASVFLGGVTWQVLPVTTS